MAEMIELPSQKDLETKITEIDDWIGHLNEKDELLAVDRRKLREVLGVLGANLELGEDTRHILGQYQNADRAIAMRIIWGRRYDEFSRWSKKYAERWEQESGIALPTIRQKSKNDPRKVLIFKNSGMLQFFGTLTALGGLTEDEYPFEDAKRLTEARSQNGRAWAEGRKGDRRRVEVPTSKKKKYLSSYPPGFPADAWEFIKKLKD